MCIHHSWAIYICIYIYLYIHAHHVVSRYERVRPSQSVHHIHLLHKSFHRIFVLIMIVAVVAFVNKGNNNITLLLLLPLP